MLSYAARIKKEADGYLVTFPDFDNVMTYGLTIEEALLNAEEALNGCLESDFERNFKIPEPSHMSGKNVHQIPVAPHVAVAIMLRALRAERSQMEIAKQLNIAYQVYQRLENPRKANPTIKTLEKIAKVFGRRVELGFV
ncbi:type II toxin-antitoxin system HicB family antitoxin [Geomonas sp. Red69]|uniref:Type II toxin-antitoxin system HicB family antitoxin n=1 Tax=Geomonas diazotrophica TaxID=2843197 RepID=A0ABX8JGD6_9BACT|nr:MULTISPECIES: type II toxin-antitoxin system HicB family antitoxin [Geomonas]MBU5635518.1 type II toxin-antitoxin system HicB family antitoxin [Geomonas diazotrophica]QWV97430.1 type II toxin-antitoxin system HicB family antitoxin [Geomonas nitrogeniifigens]QXE86588.1 type II toxin-antitoxin system HicB family antitoxin [Geomonas nitrogeniifigens]